MKYEIGKYCLFLCSVGEIQYAQTILAILGVRRRIISVLNG